MTTLSITEQRRRDLASQSEGLITEAWLHGSLWSLQLTGNPNVSVSIVSGYRPYKVIWQASGDRKVHGEWRIVSYIRSRSFAKVSSLLDFLRGM